MQKYPQLDSLTINQFKQEDYREDSDDDDDDYNWNMEPRLDKNFCVAFSRCKAEISTAVSNQFVSYLCNISTYNVNHIYVPVTNIPDTFNTYCNLSPNTSKMLEIKYQQNQKFISIGPCASIGMERANRRPAATQFSVTYSNKSGEDTQLPHLDLVEKCGSFVQDLRYENNRLDVLIKTSKTQYEMNMVYGYFMEFISQLSQSDKSHSKGNKVISL